MSTATKGGAKVKAKKAASSTKSKTTQKTSAKTKKYLVIVESPAKAKTIEKYLGHQYTVLASMGHIIDLPKSRMAVDVENNFQPTFITVRGRAKVLNALQSGAKKSDAVLLASDNDREGEAIAWHLNNAISAKNKDIPISRISFNEITPKAIKDAVSSPTQIDRAKVEAQIARRVLDRLVGYSISPILWKKVKGGLSAGRVQSVALRLICEREKEIEAWTPQEYWELFADFKTGRSAFTAQLVMWRGEKCDLKNESAVKEIIAKIEQADFTVNEIRETYKTLKPRPPFTTSQLQQTAANRLGFTSRKTMQIAQGLYEGVNLGSSRVGLITYMRTDSVRISEQALAEAREWLGKHYPEDLPPAAVHYSVGKDAQDAHEAIRPTYISYTPESVKDSLSRDEFRLYSIIWERFAASQMKPARTLTESADIVSLPGGADPADIAMFRVSGTRYVEKGWTKVLSALASKEETGKSLPPIKQGDILKARSFDPQQHWTQGPARFTDASIIKTLEENGIGRPSTYAPTISVLLDRYYVTRANKQLAPTVLGRLISNLLVENFGAVVNADFTAGMETKLDEVELKGREWTDMIREFWTPFKKTVDEVAQTLESYKDRIDEPTGEVCEKCGKPMVKKLGRYGYFLACSGFPECRNAKPLPLAVCPKCGGDIVARKTKKRGKEFYGCANYPACDFLTHFKPLANQNCPKCGWFLVEKYDKRNGSHKLCINPSCDYLHEAEEGE
ncbi:MAG: type I DNA topoisomerase [Spirochaetaceae bacterium]|jgi:DNA topoisomerase-1|nr:type I DNA topoisomerase [Spirochaetaceae bacterium]